MMQHRSYSEFNEAVCEKSEDRGRPVTCHWDLTYRCNLACRHCYLSGTGQGDELATDTVIGILDELSREGCLYLTFSGGEPFVREDFFDIYTAARSRGFLTTIFTNGTLVTEAAIRRLEKQPPVMIEITVHSLREEVFDAVTRVKGSFASCMRAIRLIHSRRLPLTLKTVALRENAGEVRRIKDFASSMNGVEFKFDRLVLPRHDLSHATLDHRLYPEEVAGLEASIDEARDQWKGFLEECHSDRPSKCSAGITFFYLDPHGNMRVCPHMVRPVYDLVRGTLQEAFSSFMPAVRKTYFIKSLKCRECPEAIFCSRCPALALLEDGDTQEPAGYFCRVARERAKTFGKYLCPA